MSTSLKTEERILHIRNWGWNVALRKTGEAVSLEVSTSKQKGYSFTVDDNGNVTESISGDYVRVVMGSVIEKTLGNSAIDAEGANIIRSGESYIALVAPKVHFNPKELKEGLKEELPAQLKEG